MESQPIEYKKLFKKEIIVSLVAFANTEGGKMIVIVDDTGAAFGVDVGTRAHNSNHLLTIEEIVALQQESLLVSFDASISQVAKADLNFKLASSFSPASNGRGRVTLRDDMLTNLTKLRLVRDGKVTLAAELLFGEPDSTIRIGRFKSAATIIDDNVVRAPLFPAVEEALTFIKKHINLSYFLMEILSVKNVGSIQWKRCASFY
ncbi:MAG: RNA-binding domain-containing protein [Pseudomonadota bacterium]